MSELKITIRYVQLFLLFSYSLFLFSCESDTEPSPTLYDSIAASPNTSTFLQAIDIAEFDDDFRSGQFLTILVPTNEAFDNFLSQNNYASLNDIPLENLRDLLRYHILSFGSSLVDLGSNYYLTASGAGVDNNFLAILIINSGTKTILNNEVEVISVDNEVNGAYYNTIGEVLSLPTNLSVIKQNEVFSQFFNGMERVVGLRDSLEENGPYTLFVTTNANVKSALNDRYDLDDIADVELASVDSLMRFHIVKGNHRSNQLLNAIDFSYETLLPDQNMDIRGTGQIFVNSQANVFLADIQTTTGVVHILDELLKIE